MNELIGIALKHKFWFHEKESKKLGVKVYTRTWNSIRHWVEIGDLTMRIYGVEEGTDGDTHIHDSGVVAYNTTLLDGLLTEILVDNPPTDAQA